MHITYFIYYPFPSIFHLLSIWNMNMFLRGLWLESEEGWFCRLIEILILLEQQQQQQQQQPPAPLNAGPRPSNRRDFVAQKM